MDLIRKSNRLTYICKHICQIYTYMFIMYLFMSVYLDIYIYVYTVFVGKLLKVKHLCSGPPSVVIKS